MNQVLITELMELFNNPELFEEIDDQKISFRDAFEQGIITDGEIFSIYWNTIYSICDQFKTQYPNVIVACDNKKFWRKEFFPFYKAHRKADRQSSNINWPKIFHSLNIFKERAINNPYFKILDVEGAEADDIIAVLTARFADENEVLIVSSDKDFVQLQKYPNVSQYSTVANNFIKIDDPIRFIKEHIIKGDRGDGIPNFLSDDNVFVTGKRQKMIKTEKLQMWVTQKPQDFCNEENLSKYNRNATLIDFENIPQEIKDRINETYNNDKFEVKNVK